MNSKAPLKIFISIPWFYPAYRAGGPVQSVANMVSACNSGLQYKICCGNTDLNEIPLENIETDHWHSYNAHTDVWYARKKGRTGIFKKLLADQAPDVLYVIGIFSWAFNVFPLLFSRAPRRIVSVRGMLHPGALSQKRNKKRLFLALWKLFQLHKKVEFHATDTTEKKYIQQVFGTGTRVHVAGNIPRSFTRSVYPLKSPDKLVLISVALISPMKNHLLVLQALQQCKANITYHIIGPVKDSAYWNLCLKLLQQMPANIEVVYHGDIAPDKIHGFLNKSHVFIMPSKSENFGHAIYEAMSAGRPVITSNHTPWNLLEQNNAGINVDTTVLAIGNAIDYFAQMDTETFAVCSEASAVYAAEKFNTISVISQYENMFFSQL